MGPFGQGEEALYQEFLWRGFCLGLLLGAISGSLLPGGIWGSCWETCVWDAFEISGTSLEQGFLCLIFPI